jgi:hypothetical protein
MKKLAKILGFSVCVVALAKAQEHDMEQMHNMHTMQRATNVKLEVQNDQAGHVLTVRLGPVNLPALAGMNVAQAPDLVMTVPIDGWFTAYHPSLVDDEGKPVPGRLLHHVAVYNLARADFLCPSKPEHIFGAGGEMNDWPLTPGIGYRVAPGEKILVATMFHNPTDKSYPKTYLQVKIEYQPAAAGGPELKSVYPTWFDVKQCGNSSYDLKPGLNVTSGEFTMRYDGVLVGLGGHMHDFGRQLHVEDVTHNQDIAVLNAKLDAQGRMIGIPIALFAEKGGVPLTKGEVVKVTATYDNPTGKPLPDGAMGIAVGYFLPSDNNVMAALERSAH